MTSTTADLFRNLTLAWWPLLLAAALVAAYVLIAFPLAVAIGRAFKAGGEEYAAEEADAIADAKWAQYLAALGLTPEDVRAQWRAQKEETTP